MFGGIGRYVVPMLEPGSRRRGLKAFPPLSERLSPWQELDALSELAVHGGLSVSGNILAGGLGELGGKVLVGP